MRPSLRRFISLLLVFLLVFGMIPQALAVNSGTDSNAVTSPTDPPVDDNDSKPPETTSGSDETVPENTTTEAVNPDTTVPSETLPPDEPEGSTPSDATTPSTDAGSGSDSTTAATTPPAESEPTDTTPPDASDSTTVSTTVPPTPSESSATTTPPSETLPPEEPDVTNPATEPNATTPDVTEPATVPDETVPVTEPEEEVYWLDAVDKGESALNVVYDEFFTEEQLAQMPAFYAPRAYVHGKHSQACNIWLSGKRLSYTFEGVSRTVDSVALHRVYNGNTGNWEVAFCLEPGVPNASSGYADSQLSAEATWGNLTLAQQRTIGLAILYGAPNNPELQTSDTRRKLAYELATYVIIQEVCLGWRNSSPPYACNNPAYINAFGKGNLEITSSFYSSVDGMYLRTAAWTDGEADEVMDAYNYISSKMAIHNIIPSFASISRLDAPTHPLTQSGSMWTTTLTDTNNILSEYAFANTGDLTFSVSGNQLTVTAAGKGPYKQVAPTRVVPNITSSGSLFRIWKTSSGAQEIITCASPRNDPVPAFFNLGPSTGTITGTKVTETGTDKGSITIQLLSGGTVVSTTTTDSNGNFSFTEVAEGTYTLREVLPADSIYYCANNDQSVTVTGGNTTSVTVTNNLKRGSISGTKNTETGSNKGNITMQLKSGSTVIATTTTDANGSFSFKNIPIGTYTVHEVLSANSAYYCANNDQSVSVTYNGNSAVTITNNLKRGNISGTKTTETGTDKGNITVQLKSGTTVIATTTTDANGSFSFKNIPIGTYTVHEVLSGNSKYYCTNNDQGVTVSYNATATVTINNNLKRGDITGTKTTETGTDKANITMQLKSGNKVIATTTTDANGTFKFTNIPIGTYTVHEVLSGNSKYYCVKNDQSVSVTYNGTTKVTFTNNLKRGNISGIKTTDTGVEMNGWTVQLLSGSTVIATTTTDANGKFAFNNIPIGTYTVHEVVPNGSAYLATTNDVSVTVTYKGNSPVEIKNTLIRGNIQLTKLDSDKFHKLSGAVFQITDARGAVHTTTETSPGIYYAENIAFGIATIKEITAPTGFLLNDKTYTVNITENGKTYTVTDTGYDGIPNAPIPGIGSGSKTSTKGITAEGYAMSIWTDRTGAVEPVTHYLKSDGSGNFYITDAGFSTKTENKNYTILGLYDGDYQITEHFSASDYSAAYTQAIHVTVTNRSGTVTFEQTFSSADLTAATVNGIVNYSTPTFAVTGLNGGGSMTVAVENHPIPGYATIKKTSTDGAFLDGYAFQMEQSNGEPGQKISYWRSDEEGKFYLTDSSFAEVPGAKTYTLSDVFDGTYTIRELIGSSMWQYSRLDSIRFTVTDKAGTVTMDTTVSGTDITQENTDFLLSQPISITGINGGGTLSIEVTNTPLPAKVTINKVNYADEPLAGAKFLLEWSLDNTTWTAVTLNADPQITIGGCQSPNLSSDGCLVSDSNGQIEFTGLHPMMNYRLIETEAPEGYVLLAEPIPVGTLFDDFQEHFRVVNGTVYNLPNTGSVGTAGLVTGGAALIALAILAVTITLCHTPCRAPASGKRTRKDISTMKKTISKIIAGILILAMVASFALPTFAASWDTSVIDMEAAASITLHKYDWTNAVKDGVWDATYVSTGTKDTNVEQILGGNARKNGDLNDEKDHPLGNGSVSNGYAVSGVEFSYLRVADIAHFTENISNGVDSYHDTRVLYGFNKNNTAALLTAIGLAGGAESFTEAAASPTLSSDSWWYESDTLNAALSDALAADVTGVKDALESYINTQLTSVDNGTQVDLHTDPNQRYDGGRMVFTDQNGYSAATNLETGLYILFETKVPETTTVGAAPAFVSLPMTRVNGGYGMTGAANETEGGHSWNYDVELYPKNESGIVTLDKQVREVMTDGGKNTDTDKIDDGFAHTATASAGDLVEYQIVSTLPSITSQATKLTTYRFNDSIAPGLTYTEGQNVMLQWYTDKDCTNLIDTWTYDEGFFSVVTDNDNHKREIAVTGDGLAIINGLADAADNVNNTATKYAGYSNYTVRITYTAKLDSDNTFVFGDAGNTNQVVLTWRRTSSEFYDTLLDDCHVYSYGIDLTKQFSDKSQKAAYGDGSAEQNKFNHVKFKVRNVTAENGIYTDGYYVIAEKNEADGIWYVTGHSANETDATIFYPLKPTNYDGEEGHIIIEGLEDDTYELTEVETADGYTLLKDRITVTISVKETDSYCSVYANEVKNGVYQNDGHYKYEGCPSLPLANIPQQGKAHHLLTASANVDGNDVSMTADFDPVTGTATIVGTTSTGEYLYSENALVPLCVINTRGFDLPQTGQDGAQTLPLIGASMFGIACISIVVVLFLIPRRKRNDNYTT